MRVTNAGVIVARMSASSPPAPRSLTASPRASRSASSASGSPWALEKRTSASTGSPPKWKALESAAASGVAVKVPSHQAPFACSARVPGLAAP